MSTHEQAESDSVEERQDERVGRSEVYHNRMQRRRPSLLSIQVEPATQPSDLSSPGSRSLGLSRTAMTTVSMTSLYSLSPVRSPGCTPLSPVEYQSLPQSPAAEPPCFPSSAPVSPSKFIEKTQRAIERGLVRLSLTPPPTHSSTRGCRCEPEPD